MKNPKAEQINPRNKKRGCSAVTTAVGREWDQSGQVEAPMMTPLKSLSARTARFMHGVDCVSWHCLSAYINVVCCDQTEVRGGRLK